ncbi:10366_t:CDS:10 [Funneliformis geosporum]|nr:10366_t:CDS:10 [Funneliformis geosporum]
MSEMKLKINPEYERSEASQRQQNGKFTCFICKSEREGKTWLALVKAVDDRCEDCGRGAGRFCCKFVDEFIIKDLEELRKSKEGLEMLKWRNDYIVNPKNQKVYTPIEVSRWVYNLISPNFQAGDVILDPCSGAERKLPHLVLCNPPFGGREDRELSESKRLQKFLKGEYPPIASIISLPVKGLWDGVIFHSEVLIFNIKELKSHYFFDSNYGADSKIEINGKQMTIEEYNRPNHFKKVKVKCGKYFSEGEPQIEKAKYYFDEELLAEIIVRSGSKKGLPTKAKCFQYKICGSCLRSLRSEKSYLKIIKDARKRQMLSAYLVANQLELKKLLTPNGLDLEVDNRFLLDRPHIKEVDNIAKLTHDYLGKAKFEVIHRKPNLKATKLNIYDPNGKLDSVRYLNKDRIFNVKTYDLQIVLENFEKITLPKLANKYPTEHQKLKTLLSKVRDIEKQFIKPLLEKLEETLWKFFYKKGKMLPRFMTSRDEIEGRRLEQKFEEIGAKEIEGIARGKTPTSPYVPNGEVYKCADQITKSKHPVKYTRYQCKNTEGVVEMDENYQGGANPNRHKNKKAPKAQVIWAGVERNSGNMIAKISSNAKRSALEPLVRANIKEGSIVCADEYKVYDNLYKWFDLQRVNHGIGQYVNAKTSARASTNVVENRWSHLNRMIYGIYIKISRKHAQKYVDEFVFRNNTRKYSDEERCELILTLTAVKKKVSCEIHGSHEIFVKKEKDGEVQHVRIFTNKKRSSDKAKTNDEAKLDKMLEACTNTPPITLKQIKEELKKERDEKKRSSPSGKKETIRMIENFRGRTDKGMTFIYYSYFNAPEYPNRFIYKRDANNPNRYYYLPLDYSAVSLGGGVYMVNKNIYTFEKLIDKENCAFCSETKTDCKEKFDRDELEKCSECERLYRQEDFRIDLTRTLMEQSETNLGE